MKVATWNVNSVRVRYPRLLRWLDAHEPDVLCLQELKGLESVFPTEALQAMGYHSAAYGQKTYNGVAILSRAPLSDVRRGFDDDEDDPQARLIAATVGDVQVLSAYIPNGKTVDAPHYQYKLRWLRRLRTLLEERYDPGDPLLLCGDFNIIPEVGDVAQPELFEGGVLYTDEVREALDALHQWGLTDTYRQHHDQPGVYSWWDYRGGAFRRNNGARIDFVLATAPMAASCVGAFIDKHEREASTHLSKPSDHAPVVARFGR